jgi:hypothetical protein
MKEAKRKPGPPWPMNCQNSYVGGKDEQAEAGRWRLAGQGRITGGTCLPLVQGTGCRLLPRSGWGVGRAALRGTSSRAPPPTPAPRTGNIVTANVCVFLVVKLTLLPPFLPTSLLPYLPTSSFSLRHRFMKARLTAMVKRRTQSRGKYFRLEVAHQDSCTNKCVLLFADRLLPFFKYDRRISTYCVTTESTYGVYSHTPSVLLCLSLPPPLFSPAHSASVLFQDLWIPAQRTLATLHFRRESHPPCLTIPESILSSPALGSPWRNENRSDRSTN